MKIQPKKMSYSNAACIRSLVEIAMDYRRAELRVSGENWHESFSYREKKMAFLTSAHAIYIFNK